MQLVPLSTDGRVAVPGAVALPAGRWQVVLRPDGDTVALEVPEPAGPRRVGRLAPPDGAAYRPVLAALAARGLHGTCALRVTDGGGRPRTVVLELGPPAACVLRNTPADLVLLAAEQTVALTLDDHHLDALAGQTGRVGVELAPCTIGAGRYSGHAALEIRLGGHRIGELTRRMSERYGPLAGAVAARGGRPGCEALLHHHREGHGVRVELRLPVVGGPHGAAASPARPAATGCLATVPSPGRGVRNTGGPAAPPARPGPTAVVDCPVHGLAALRSSRPDGQRGAPAARLTRRRRRRVLWATATIAGALLVGAVVEGSGDRVAPATTGSVAPGSPPR